MPGVLASSGTMASSIRENLKTVPVPDAVYPDVSWDVYASSYDAKKKIWPFIDKRGGVHTLSLEAFENHLIVVNLKNRTEPIMIKTLTYKESKGKGGRNITQEQAYSNNMAFDPNRATTPTVTRVIPAAPSSGGLGSGASTSSDAGSASGSPAKRGRGM